MSEDGKSSEEEVEREAREILDEMGHAMFLPAVRCLALLLRPFVCTALRGIFVNSEGLEKVGERLHFCVQNHNFQRSVSAGCSGVHL